MHLHAQKFIIPSCYLFMEITSDLSKTNKFYLILAKKIIKTSENGLSGIYCEIYCTISNVTFTYFTWFRFWAFPKYFDMNSDGKCAEIISLNESVDEQKLDEVTLENVAFPFEIRESLLTWGSFFRIVSQKLSELLLFWSSIDLIFDR